MAPSASNAPIAADFRRDLIGLRSIFLQISKYREISGNTDLISTLYYQMAMSKYRYRNRPSPKPKSFDIDISVFDVDFGFFSVFDIRYSML